MPIVTVEGEGSFEVVPGTKLVLCLEDNGVDVLHRCGGNAKCTTCRVEVLEEATPEQTDAEKTALARGEPGLIDRFRLSCQIRVVSDLKVRVANRSRQAGISPGPRPAP